MWFQKAEADLKCLAYKGNGVVQVVVEKSFNTFCGAATGLAVEFIKPTSAADVIESIVIRLVTDGTKHVVIGHPQQK